MPLSYLQVELPPTFYLKNPTSSELGKKIVAGGLELFNSKGYLHFTLKELAQGIGCTEASIYRYFSSKSQLLAYCSSVYWVLLKHRLEMYTLNITDIKLYLDRIIDVLLDELRDEQYVVLANKDFSHFRTLACRYSISILGMVDQTEEQNKLVSDYQAILGHVYRFVEDAVKKLKPKSHTCDLLANAIVSSTHVSATRLEFLKNNLSETEPVTDNRIRRFLESILY